MKGTEKQIEWATDIKNTIIITANEAYNTIVNDPQYDSNNESHVHMAEIYKSWIQLAEKEERAAFFIETFSRVDAAAPLMQRLKSIRSAMVVNPMPKEWRYK